MSSGIDRYYTRNATGIAAVEFFWGLGFPVIMESTFLQVFLKHLGASNFLIGLVPAMLMLGVSVFPLVSSYYCRNFAFQRSLVMNLHLVSSLSTLGFGLFLLFMTDPALILPAFFISYGIFSVCIGLTFPVWLNFLVKIFSVRKSLKGLSVMYMAQNLAKIIASIFILKMVETFSFSLVSAAWIFLVSGILFLIGSFFFLMTHEMPEPIQEIPDSNGIIRHTKNTLKDILGNKRLLFFLVGDLDNYIVLTIMAFYANYAVQHFAIGAATATGLFVCAIYFGSILTNIALGTLDMLNLKTKFLSTKVMCMAMLLILIFFPGFWGFLLASLMMGFCRGVRGILYSPLIKRFSGRTDATSYFAVAPLLTLIFSVGYPLIFGLGLDWTSDLGSLSYKIMFSIAFILTGITLTFGFMTDFNR